MQTERPLRYLALIVGLPTLLMLATGAFSLAVDPFGLYRVFPAREGFNAQKGRQQGHERMVRAADLARLAPDALILGTSRAQVGLDPEAAAWAGIASHPANAAFSDGSTYEALRYLQHADAISPVKVVVFGADYLSFIGTTRFTEDFTESRLSVGKKGEPQRFFALDDVPAALLSFDTLRISRRTILEQEIPSYFFETGRRRPTTMEARIAEQGGARGAFMWSERDYADSYVCAQPARLSTHLKDLDALVDYCREKKIRLVVVSSPSHVRSLALLEVAGLWPEVQRFRRELVRRSGDPSAPLGTGFEFWEFSGADPRTTAEEVPPVGDTTTRSAWYWESSHYRKELGDVVLERVFGRAGNEAFAGWGERVTPATGPAAVERVHAELMAWMSAHPADVAELQKSLAAARAEPHCEGAAP